MQRTTIEAAADGHILITLERTERKGGNAHQRRIERKRELNDQLPPEWYRMGRIILRNGVPQEIPVKFAASKAFITLLPMGSLHQQAYENSIAAAEGVGLAEVIVADIDHHIATMAALKPVYNKRARIVWEDPDDWAEAI